MSSVVGKAKHLARAAMLRAYPHLPASVQHKIVERRHIKIVVANLVDQVPSGFLHPGESVECGWSNPDVSLKGPDVGLSLTGLTESDSAGIRTWLTSQPFDSDENLDMRMDGFHDEVGRTIAALNTRLRLQTLKGTRIPGGPGTRVLVDVRSLQTSVISGRGIGRFVAAAVNAIIDAAPTSVTLLVDPGKHVLPDSVIRSCPTISHVTDANAGDFSTFIQPSPMTSPVNPFEVLLNRDIVKVALIYDFIPGDFPSVYLTRYATRAEYCAALDSLPFYTDYVCISHITKAKLIELGINEHAARNAVVAWPESVLGDTTVSETAARSTKHSNRIVVMSGDEPRKNTIGALGAAGAVTSSEGVRDISVIGMPRHQDLVHHLSMYAAIRPGEVTAQPHLSDSDLAELIASSGVALVLSFDEGLSLPVIEALRHGTPVVASDIPAHRELLGQGAFLADPHSVPDMVRAIHAARHNRALAREQYQRVIAHHHESLERVVAHFAHGAAGVSVPARSPQLEPRRMSVGIATPWAPQASGVADFSTTIFSDMARHVDLTVYVTDSVLQHREELESAGITVRAVSELLARSGHHEHDHLVSVVGNSHFHLPFIELLSLTPCVVVAHDTRMVEFYMALRGLGGAEEVMLTALDSRDSRLRPPLEEQISDMRLLQNLGMWEVARRANTLIMHSVSCQELITRQTGVTPVVLPFSNQRVPAGDVDSTRRQQARERVGFTTEYIHLVTFGYVDLRTKLNDQLLAAAGWLTAWGHPVHVTFAGGASESVTQELMEIAGRLGVPQVSVTGFLAEPEYQDYLLAADVGIQLRVSDFLGVSGPLSDLAAFGTTSIASEGLARDISAPPYVHPISVWSNGMQIAEEIIRVTQLPTDTANREHQRQEYLDRMSPQRYVEHMMEMLRVKC